MVSQFLIPTWEIVETRTPSAISFHYALGSVYSTVYLFMLTTTPSGGVTEPTRSRSAPPLRLLRSKRCVPPPAAPPLFHVGPRFLQLWSFSGMSSSRAGPYPALPVDLLVMGSAIPFSLMVASLSFVHLSAGTTSTGAAGRVFPAATKGMFKDRTV